MDLSPYNPFWGYQGIKRGPLPPREPLLGVTCAPKGGVTGVFTPSKVTFTYGLPSERGVERLIRGVAGHFEGLWGRLRYVKGRFCVQMCALRRYVAPGQALRSPP